jgi:hypothetical protein
MKLMGGAHMAVTWEREGVVAGMRKVKGKTPFGKYVKAALGQMGWAWTRRLVGQSGPARARLSLLGQNLRRILFRIKIGFLNIPSLWKFAQGDLGGILTWGFFLKSSRLSKYFRKMKYAMP